jgi:hypothetical protein
VVGNHTRRALLGAGAVALLAGCGPEEKPEVDAGAVLDEQLRVSRAVVDAYGNVPAAGSLRSNAEARVHRIDTALEPLRGEGGELEAKQTAETGLEAALAAESVALRAHVAAVGLLRDREWRELLAGLIVDSSTNQAALRLLLDQPPLPTAFPGEPVR